MREAIEEKRREKQNTCHCSKSCVPALAQQTLLQTGQPQKPPELLQSVARTVISTVRCFLTPYAHPAVNGADACAWKPPCSQSLSRRPSRLKIFLEMCRLVHPPPPARTLWQTHSDSRSQGLLEGIKQNTERRKQRTNSQHNGLGRERTKENGEHK